MEFRICKSGINAKAKILPSFDTPGTLTVINNQLSVKAGTSRIKVPVKSIELWTGTFINFTMVFELKHKETITELLKYMTIIRGAASSYRLNRWTNYDM